MSIRKELASLSASVLALVMLGVFSPVAWAANVNAVSDDVIEAGPTPLTTSPKRPQPEPGAEDCLRGSGADPTVAQTH